MELRYGIEKWLQHGRVEGRRRHGRPAMAFYWDITDWMGQIEQDDGRQLQSQWSEWRCLTRDQIKKKSQLGSSLTDVVHLAPSLPLLTIQMRQGVLLVGRRLARVLLPLLQPAVRGGGGGVPLLRPPRAPVAQPPAGSSRPVGEDAPPLRAPAPQPREPAARPAGPAPAAVHLRPLLHVVAETDGGT